VDILCLHPVLDRQKRLGTLFRQLYVKGIEDEGRLGIMTHQGRQLRQVLGPELIQCSLERLLADFVGLEKLRSACALFARSPCLSSSL